MSVELLQEQVELNLEYAAGFLSKWHNFLGPKLRDFFKSNMPASVHTALTWVSKAPEPAAVPRNRPRDGMVWIATGNPIFNDAGSVTGYDGAWVCVNAGDDPGVKPARRPRGPAFKNKEWNGKATAIENEEGVVTAYAGAWVHGDPQDESSAVQPAKRPNHRPKKGMVWNDKAHAMKNEP